MLNDMDSQFLEGPLRKMSALCEHNIQEISHLSRFPENINDTHLFPLMWANINSSITYDT